MFLGLARAAEHWTPLEVAVDDVRLLAQWAEKMAVTNELTSGFPKVATTAMGQALLRGETIRSAAVWAARHPADYMLLTALSHPVVSSAATPVRGADGAARHDHVHHLPLLVVARVHPRTRSGIIYAGGHAAVRARAVDADLASEQDARIPANGDGRCP